MMAVNSSDPNATVWANGVDYVYCIQDSTWGGYVAGAKATIDHRLNPTSQVVVGVSTVVIGIGGGGVTYAELQESQRSGNLVTRFGFGVGLTHRASFRRRDSLMLT
jgi:hypothetical protein